MRAQHLFGVLAVAATVTTTAVGLAQQSAPPTPANATNIRNFLKVTPDFCTGGQPRLDVFTSLKSDGVKAVLNLRTADEYAIDDEKKAVEAAGLKYFNIPVIYRDPKFEQADEFLKVTDDPANRPLFIHCTAAIRVGGFWLIRRVLRDNWTWDAALEDAKKVGLLNAPHLEEFAKNYIASKKK